MIVYMTFNTQFFFVTKIGMYKLTTIFRELEVGKILSRFASSIFSIPGKSIKRDNASFDLREVKKKMHGYPLFGS